MGSLPRHLSSSARRSADVVVLTVYVNPIQFGSGEDFDTYPRNLARDADLAIAAGVDYLFAPETHEMYPTGASTFVEVEGLSSRLEGVSRPGHFRGVATVVLKLIEVVAPAVAAFGQKDAQQALVVDRMARDLLLDTRILVCPIVRDLDGVALSSRNVYLSPEQRTAARSIPAALAAAEQAWAGGASTPAEIVQAARAVLEAEPLLRIDYLELVDTETLAPLRDLREVRGGMLLALAVFCGSTRLIDNVVLREAKA
jgi:pantoate--beta-alanine ligase